MGKIKFQQIGTFADFCKPENKIQIKENNEVAIDVPFWDEAISPDGPILNDLHYAAGNPVSWEGLVNYIKIKYQILDREDVVGDENLVISHLRDLLFQHYGDTILNGNYGCLTYDSAEKGTKCLVISELANEIFRRLRIEAGKEEVLEPETTPEPQSKVSLEYGYYEDLPFEQRRKVVGYEEFSKLINESVSKIKCEHDDRCLDYVLNVIQADCGGLNLDKIRETAKEENKDINGYIARIVDDYLSKEGIELNGKTLKKEGEKAIFNQAKKLFSFQTAKEVLAIISKENQSKK